MTNQVSMISLVKEYIEHRRRLGFQIRADKEGGELLGFGRYADGIGYSGPITTEIAVQWARDTKFNAPIHWARRLDMVRGFAQYRALFDPRTEIPPKGIIGSSRYPRKTPHIYSDEEISILLKTVAAINHLGNSVCSQTYATIFGLLSCTGMRVSEALALKKENVNLTNGVLHITETKFSKSRLVPILPSAVTALRAYADYRDQSHPVGNTNHFFLTRTGKPVPYYKVLTAFVRLRRKLGWSAEGRVRQPRIHDLRYPNLNKIRTFFKNA